MGFHRGPKIVTDGLVLYLDAANTRSYPGTGTTWNDLSGKGNHATLYNSPTFSNGAVQFRTSTQQYASVIFNEGVLKPSNLTGKWTLESVFKNISAPLSSESFIVGRVGCHGGIQLANNGVNSVLYHAIKTASCWTGAANTIITTLVPNQSIHTAMVYDNGIITSYVNGVYISTTIYDHATYGMAGYNDSMFIGGYPNETAWRTNSDIYVIKAYNKALTATEILQNYNATKSRYGL
jgi:hypothetical protein